MDRFSGLGSEAERPVPWPQAWDRVRRMAQQLEYSVGDYVVYPAHGVGRIAGIETTTVGQMAVELSSITFVKARMPLTVPDRKSVVSGKCVSVGVCIGGRRII